MAGPTLLSVLRHVWLTLEACHLPMAVMGGIGVSAWRHVRATQDVDVLVGVEQTSLEELLRQLAAAQFKPKRQPPIVSLGTVRILQLLYEPPGAFMEFQIDLLLAESDYHRQSLGRRVSAQLPGLDFAVQVLSCEDLILHKLLAGRIIDRSDAAALLRINEISLDLRYLGQWISKLGLNKDWGEIWGEAFPGRTPPALPVV